MTMHDRTGGRVPCNLINVITDAADLAALLDIPEEDIGPVLAAGPFLSIADLRYAANRPRGRIEQVVSSPRLAYRDKLSGQERAFRIAADCFVTSSAVDSEELEALGFQAHQEPGDERLPRQIVEPKPEAGGVTRDDALAVRNLFGPEFSPVVIDGEGNQRFFVPLGIDIWIDPRRSLDDVSGLFARNDVTAVWSSKVAEDQPTYVAGRCRSVAGVDGLTTVLQTVDRLNQSSDVLFAEPQEFGPDDFGPDVGVDAPADFEAADRDWVLEATRVGEAHLISRGSSDVTVFLVDSGMALEHPDVADALRPDWSDHDLNYSVFEAPALTSPAVDRIHHGTQVASVVAGQGTVGSAVNGVAPGCKVLPLKIAGVSSGYGARAAAIRQCLALIPADGRGVINLSWGMNGDHSGIHQALLEAARRNVPVVTSGGNYRPGQVPEANKTHYPSAYSHIEPPVGGLCAVGATTFDGTTAPYSYFGDKSITFGAPGGEGGGSGSSVYVASGARQRAFSYGTSFAAPHVSGTLGLILSVAPDMTAEGAIELIRRSCRPIIGDRILGAGLIDVGAAVRAASVRGGSEVPDEQESVYINSAPVEDLVAGLGISAWRAQRTVDYRDRNGPFGSVWDLVFTGVWDFRLIRRLKDKMTLNKPV